MKQDMSWKVLGAVVVLVWGMLGRSAIPVGAWPIPDTGQMTSYETGDDGYYSLNPPSYTKLGLNDVELPDTATTGDGWVATRDNVTGLSWQVAVQTSTWINLQAVVKAANTAQVGGHNDWRVPTIKELQSIVNYGDYSPAIDLMFFPSTGGSSYFWSSSLGASLSSYAWSVYFSNGFVQGYSKNYFGIGVRLVRGGQGLDLLSGNGDGTVTDIGSGLMWQQTETGQAMSWSAALSQCQGLTLGGYEGWRLPTAKELLSIVDFGHYDPAIDQAAFLGTKSSAYWSSTSFASDTSSAWYVLFTNGYVGSYGKASDGDVRCVRGGPVTGAFGSSVILSPPQAASVIIFEKQVITWEPKDLGGQVVISLSRDGGKSWEIISASTANDGAFDWVVGGPASANCVLKVEPIGSPEKAGYLGLFSIATLGQLTIVPTATTKFSVYDLDLAGQLSNGVVPDIDPAAATWALSDPSVATLTGTTLSANKNGSVQVTVTIGGLTATTAIPLIELNTFDAYEGSNNDTTTLADFMPANEVWQGQMLSGDSDWFKITLPQDAIIDLAFVSSSVTADVKIEVQNTSGQSVFATSQDGKSQILTLSLKAGTSYIHLAPAGVIDQNEFYYLIWQVNKFQALGTSTVLTVGTSQEITLYSLFDSHTFTFTAQDQNAINLLFQPTSPSSDTTLKLSNSAGTVLGTWSSQNGQAFSINQNLANDTYSLTVTQSADLDVNHPYTVGLSTWPGEVEPNNSAVQTTDLPKGETYKALLPTGDIDLFTFTVAQPSLVQFDLASDSVTADYRLSLTKEGETTPFNAFLAGNHQAATWQAGLAAGTYQIKVEPNGDKDPLAFYSLAWTSSALEGIETEPNNSAQSAVNLLKDTTVKALLPTGDADFYRFILPQPALIQLGFTSTSTTADYRLTLYKGSEAYPTDGTVLLNGQAANLSVGLMAGDYLVKIETNGDIDQLAFYSLALTTGGLISGQEIEPNNTLQTANGLSSTAAVQGRIYAASDQDLYGFTIDAEALLTINFTPTVGTLADYTIEMLNATGTLIPGNSKTSTNGVATFIKFKPAPGTYFVRVKSGGDVNQFAQYSLSMTTTAQVAAMVKLAGLSVTATSKTLNVGQNASLIMTAYYSDASALAKNAADGASFVSSDPSVLMVDADGQITGMKDGHATVTVAYQDKAAAIDITVGAPQTTAKQGHGNLLIVAGGTLNANDTLKQATLYISELAYQKFQARNFTDDDIYFMSQTAFHDLHGDGYDDGIVDDLTPTTNEVTAAITGWAKDQASSGPLYVYLADHGADQQFQVASGEIMAADQLNTALDIFQQATGRPVVVIIEACYSGSFVAPLTSTSYKRLILTSVDAKNPGYLSSDGTASYSSFLFANLYQGKSLAESLAQTKADLAAIDLPYKQMAPQIAGTENLQGSKVGGDFVLAGSFPEISGHTASQAITAGSLSLNAQVSSLGGGLSVWAVIVPPDYSPPTVSGNFVSTVDGLPKVVLVDEDATTKMMDGLFTGNYGEFSKNGKYLVIFYAKDSDNNLVKSAPVTITVNGGVALTTTTTTAPTTTTSTTTTLPVTTTSTTTSTATSTTTEMQSTTTTSTAAPTTTTTEAPPISTSTSTTTTTSSTTTTILNSTSATTSPVAKGWSLLSSTIGFQAATIFGDQATFTSVWKWTDNDKGVKTWAVYLPGSDSAAYAASKGFMALAEIKSGEGFWVNATADKQVEINGVPEYGDLTFAKGGWNLVGLKGKVAKPVAELMPVISVWKWEGSTWAVFLPDGDGGVTYAKSKGFIQLTTIKPGEGFWVNMPEI